MKTLSIVLVILVLIAKGLFAAEAKITPVFINSLPPLPEWAVTKLKIKENYDLALKPKTISRSADGEVGYGVTDNEVEDAIRAGFLPKGSKLPQSMTKAEADAWMEHVTIPTYRMIVRKTVTVRLSLEQEASLTFFAQNEGHRNLERLVTPKGRLNDRNYASVGKIMPLYYRPAKLKSRCDFQVSLFQTPPPVYIAKT